MLSRAVAVLLLLSVSCGDSDTPDASIDAAMDGASDDVLGLDAPTDVPADGEALDAGDDAGEPIDPQPPLPPQAAATTARFTTSDTCATCHAAEVGSSALRDAAGRDVSMHNLWRASMMAFAARDPFYLAAFSHELESNESGQEYIEATCTRCHAPAASEQLAQSGAHTTFAALTTSTEAVQEVGRDGVTCTLCHQITAESVATDDAFTGGFATNDERTIYGPHADPFGMPMVRSTGYTPAQSEHVRESELCASCHTVITRALDDAGNPTGPAFAEQAPYLEWRNSDFEGEASCQSCHVPTMDEDGRAIMTQITTRPGFVEPRTMGRHVFVGANAHMLELIADNLSWIGVDMDPELLRERARLSEQNLQTAATIELASLSVEAGTLQARVRVSNQAGHKFPTGYPSRRAWVRFTVLGADGAVLWESGAFDDAGRLASEPADYELHHDVIDRPDQTQIYESVMADASGETTSVLLDATRYLKDNRILPTGWSAGHPDAVWTMPAGVEGDESFTPGRDETLYRLELPDGAARVRVELWYQTLSPALVDAYREHATPMTERFRLMTEAHPPMPRLVDQAEATLE